MLGSFVAGAAAAYYLYGPNAKAHQKNAKSWMLKARGEILDRAEKLKDVDKAQYYELIDKMSAKYKKLKSVDNKELKQMVNELKKNWPAIEREARRMLKKGEREAKKVVNKTAKKVVKKTAKKPVKKTTKRKTTVKKK